MQKCALTIQSLACHGKCSITEALPLISAQGISLSVLPTVILSTHTGGFNQPARLDTTQFLSEAIAHFEEQDITFDGIYTGYFASKAQIELANESIEGLKKKNCLVLVDPVLGDNGRLFSGLTEGFKDEMLKLCRKADIIVPNITEACLLCEVPYNPDFTMAEIEALAKLLHSKTNATVVITGVKRETEIGALCFNGKSIAFIGSQIQPQSFHGTGDIFSSLLFAGLLNGADLENTVKKATDFISLAIKNTISQVYTEKNGVNFEHLIQKEK